MTLFRSALPAFTLALTMTAPAAWAQTPAAPLAAPVQAPPAGYAGPPAGYVPPPPVYAGRPEGYTPPLGYAPPPGYGYGPRVPGGPATLPYEEGSPTPYGYHPERQIRPGLVIGGAVTFGVMYVLSAVPATFLNDKSLLVPVAGPFIQLGHLDFSPSIEDRGFTSGAAVLLAIDGLVQAAGAAMLIAGLTSKKEVLVRDDVAGVTVRVTPLTMGYGGAGIGLVGTM